MSVATLRRSPLSPTMNLRMGACVRPLGVFLLGLILTSGLMVNGCVAPGGGDGAPTAKSGGGSSKLFPTADVSAEFYQLLADLKDPSTANDGKAIEGLVAMGEPVVLELLNMLHVEENPGARESMAKVLTKIGPSIIPKLEKALDVHSERILRYVPLALGGMGKPAIPVLMKLLASPDASTRQMGIKALALTADEEAAAKLAELLTKETEVGLQIDTISALNKLRKAASVEPLLKFVETQKEPKPLAAGVESLGYHAEFDLAKVTKALRDFLKHPAADVREAAAKALGYSKDKDKKTVAELRRTLGDTEKTVRAATAMALGMIGAKEAVHDIQKQMEKETDPFVKRTMQQAMQNLR